jgi:hypothetical protein
MLRRIYSVSLYVICHMTKGVYKSYRIKTRVGVQQLGYGHHDRDMIPGKDAGCYSLIRIVQTGSGTYLASEVKQ